MSCPQRAPPGPAAAQGRRPVLDSLGLDGTKCLSLKRPLWWWRNRSEPSRK